jgi:Zn-dependent peptidase ImmA (M78 family)
MKSSHPYQQGAALARELRRHLQLGHRPIPSLRDFVAEQWPSLTVLHAELGNHGPAGLSFVDAMRGPTIVLNLNGKNQNHCVRRFSLAHELCHLLVDWNGSQPIATISGYFNDSALDREQRANSFAVRFLCPPKILSGCDLDNSEHRKKLARYGLPYAAWRLYLRNELGDLPETTPKELLDLGTDEQWQRAEEPRGVEGFPLPQVPPERRTEIARVAARLYSLGEIPRDEFAEMLQVTPAADLEQVLNFFALDPPKADVAAL